MACLKVWSSDYSPNFSAIHFSPLRAELLKSLRSTVPKASLQSSIQCLLNIVFAPFENSHPMVKHQESVHVAIVCNY